MVPVDDALTRVLFDEGWIVSRARVQLTLGTRFGRAPTHALVSLTGPAAARRVFDYWVDPMGVADERAARLFLSRPYAVPDSEYVTRALPWWQRRADRLVEGYWAWIVACALELWRELSAAEVLRLRKPDAVV